jgi:uncharacterized membrane protein
MTAGIAFTLHLIAINIWVGGMFFVVVVFSHVTAPMPLVQRLDYWRRALARFFMLVWLAMLVLLGSGGVMIYEVFGSPGNSPLYVLLMASFALVMMAIFVYIYFQPYRQFTRHLKVRDLAAAEHWLLQLRRLGKLNAVIGLCAVIVIGIGSHYLS